MKIFFYQATTAFPSLKSYEWIGGENSKVFFSHGMEFDKATITSSLPVNLKGSEERIYLIPVAWKAQFLALLNEKYGNLIEAPVEHPLSPESKPSKEEIGSGWTEELAKFYEEVQVVTILKLTKPVVEPPPGRPDPPCDLRKFPKFIFSELKYLVSSILEQGLLLGGLIVFLLLFGVIWLTTVQRFQTAKKSATKAIQSWQAERYEDAYSEARQALEKDKYNSEARAILVVLAEYKTADAMRLKREGNDREARKLAQQVVEINPTLSEEVILNTWPGYLSPIINQGPPVAVAPPIPRPDYVCYTTTGTDKNLALIAGKCCQDKQRTTIETLAEANGINLNKPYSLATSKTIKIPRDLLKQGFNGGIECPPN